MSGVLPEYRGWSEPSIARKVTEGQGLTTYFASGLSGAVGNHKASVAMMSGDRRIAERNSCRAELFLVSQPGPDARIKLVRHGRLRPRNQDTSTLLAVRMLVWGRALLPVQPEAQPRQQPRRGARRPPESLLHPARKRRAIIPSLPSASPRS